MKKIILSTILMLAACDDQPADEITFRACATVDEAVGPIHECMLWHLGCIEMIAVPWCEENPKDCIEGADSCRVILDWCFHGTP